MNDNLYHVSFPKLGINLEISPIAFTMGLIEVNWYGLILAMSFLAAFGYIYRRSKDFKIDKDKLIDVVIACMFCGIIGARLYYVIFYPGNFYKINPIEIFNIHKGGIAIYGGVIGGAIGGITLAKIKNIKLLPLLDLLSIGLILGQAIGRWGNFFNQEAFGGATTLPWGMVSEETMGRAVHPCFLYESVWCLIGFFILHKYSKAKKIRSGEIFNIYLFWYGLGRFLIEKLRADSLMFMNIKVSEYFSLGLIVLSICAFLKIKSTGKAGGNKKFN